MENIILTPISIDELMQKIREVVSDEIKKQKNEVLQEKLMTAQETANFLRVSLVTIWQWEKQGRIVKHNIGGKVYFKYSELMGSLESLRRYKKP